MSAESPVNGAVAASRTVTSCTVPLTVSHSKPDSLAKGRTYDRNYFFTIMFHVHPDHTLKLIRHATEQRMKGQPGVDDEKTIKVNAEWKEKLLAHPFLS